VKIFLILAVLFMNCSILATGQEKLLYDFKVETIDGEPFDMKSLKGKMVMIVNTASKCSLAPQFKKLQALFEEYGGEDFIILAFPSNDFFGREPGTNQKIKKSVKEKYGITFPLMAKISVKGKNIHPLYSWLTISKQNGRVDAPVKWNFQKFLIDREGRVIDFIPPATRPDCQRTMNWLKEGLSQNR
jgi:glutathione peroxidase